MTDSPYHRFNSLKILAYADKLRQIADGGYPYPIDWAVYASNRCDHACVWCLFRQNGEQENFPVKLPRKLLLRAVEDAARTGAVLMQFEGGGEPLLNRYTVDAMSAAQNAGLKVALSTNGTHLTPEVARVVDYIRVSLNAGTAEQHRKTNHGGDLRHPGDWVKILENIRRSAPHKRQDIGLAFVVDHENYGDIYPFCEIAADIGVDFVHIRPAFWYDAESDQRTHGIMPEALAICDRAQEAFGDRLKIFAITEKFDGYWTPRTYDRCRAVLSGIVLRATGDFAVCKDRVDLTFGHQPSYAAGASFEEVWHSEEHKRLVASIVSPGILDQCPRCVWNFRNVVLKEVFEEDNMRLAMV